MSFLIVDDDVVVSRAIARILRPLRPALVARRAALAEAMLDREPAWTAFLVDVHLGAGQPSGLDFLARARVRFPQVPAAVVSADPDPALINRAYALGATFLCKPCPPEHLTGFAARAVVQQIVRNDGVCRVVADVATERGLSPCETELLALAVVGTPREDLVRVRGVSVNTHKTQVRTLLQKVGAKDLDRLALRVLRMALGTDALEAVRVSAAATG